MLALVLSMPVLEDKKLIETTDIAHITSYVDKDTLVLLDLDNTVIQLTQALGTPEWFADFYKKKCESGMLHDEAMKKTVSIYLRVNEISEAKPVDIRTTVVVRNLQEQGINILGLTARDDVLYQTTIRHLKPTKINFNFGKFKDYQLKLNTGDRSKIQNGIIFAGGKHKGECLGEFLAAIDWAPKRIVFVDDQLKALQEVEHTATKIKILYIGVRYGYLDHKARNLNPNIAEIQLRHLNKTGCILSDDEALAMLEKETS